MLKDNSLLEEINNAVNALTTSYPEPGNFHKHFESLAFQLNYMSTYPNKYNAEIKDKLAALVTFSTQFRAHGLSKGTMGSACILVEGSRIPGGLNLFEDGLDVANCFLEHFSNDLGLASGVSGTLVGCMSLHSITKRDWLLEDINIYLNYLIDKLAISRDGFFLTKAYVVSSGIWELNACFAFIKASEYLRNKSYLLVAVELYNNEQKKIRLDDDIFDDGVFWDSWIFAFGVISMMLFKKFHDPKYHENFDKAREVMSRASSTPERIVNHMLLSILNAIEVNGKIESNLSDEIESVVQSTNVWVNYPSACGNMLLACESKKPYNFLRTLFPFMEGKLTAEQKSIPQFKNVLRIRQYAISSRMIENRIQVPTPTNG